MNKSTWFFKDMLADLLQQWHILLIVFVAGAAIGWLTAELLPAPYQATIPLYIGLETYRAYSDPAFSAYANQEYSNQDDYKNWQMSQLNELILAKDYLEDTLSQLQEQDAAWKDASLKTLRRLLSAEWRTAGRWNLIARHPNRSLAEQAVRVWEGVVLEKTNQAIHSAQEMIKIDIRLQAIREQEMKAKARYLKLQAVLRQIQEFSAQLRQLPQDEPLAPSLRWKMLTPLSLAADFSPAWIALLNKMPSETALPSAYLDWFAEAETLASNEARMLLNQGEEFNRQFNVEYEKYLSAVKDSRGVSPNLIIEKVSPAEELEVIQPRSAGQFAIVGGLLGWVGYLIYYLITMQRSKAEEKQTAALSER